VLTHIFEHAGIMLQVGYTQPQGEDPTFHTVHLLDANYKVCGPNIVELLHRTAIIIGEPIAGHTPDAQTFLSAIAEDLP
jgi:hypothetical protein